MYFDAQNFSFLGSTNLSFFSFVVYAVSVKSKNPLLNPSLWRFTSMFSSIKFLLLYLSCWSIWVDFWIWCEVRVQPHSFACCYPVALLKRLFFLPLNGLGAHIKNSVSRCLFLFPYLSCLSHLISPSPPFSYLADLNLLSTFLICCLVILASHVGGKWWNLDVVWGK